MPNDEAEADRLDLLHHIWRLTAGGALYKSPLKSPQRILDLGTGTGICTWSVTLCLNIGINSCPGAIEVGDEFPQATVIGTDLSPIQPGKRWSRIGLRCTDFIPPGWVPPNVRFYVEDFDDQWTFRDDEKFDFIHARNVAGATTSFPRLYEQALNHLSPGAWFEYQDYNAW